MDIKEFLWASFEVWVWTLMLYSFSFVKINQRVWGLFQEYRRPSFLSGFPFLIYGSHQASLQQAGCTYTLRTLPIFLSCVNINLTKWRSNCLFCSSRSSHGAHTIWLLSEVLHHFGSRKLSVQFGIRSSWADTLMGLMKPFCWQLIC